MNFIAELTTINEQSIYISKGRLAFGSTNASVNCMPAGKNTCYTQVLGYQTGDKFRCQFVVEVTEGFRSSPHLTCTFSVRDGPQSGLLAVF